MHKGFTLIELLIVIGIIAILATVLVVILNPAQLLAQARDATRISDLSSLRSAINLFLITSPTPILGESPISQGGHATGGNGGCWSLTGTCVTTGPALLYTVDGTGWVAVNFTTASGGSPLAFLPRDPSNTAAFHYAYRGNNVAKTFEINAVLESERYAIMMVTDGGNSTTTYEVGTAPGLAL